MIDCVAILLGRKGSKGMPGKNTMRIFGKPISHYPMLAASNSKYISDIFLSTDDENIKIEAKNFNVHTINNYIKDLPLGKKELARSKTQKEITNY